MKPILLAVPLLLAGTNNDDWPPQRFRKEVVATVVFVHPSKIDRFCGSAPPGFTKLACAGKVDGENVIIMPHPCVAEPSEYTKLQCHEIAHLHGWSADHEK